jgi:hypothetical protein
LKLLVIEPTLSERLLDELKGQEGFAATHSKAFNELKRAVREETLSFRETTSELVHNLGL